MAQTVIWCQRNDHLRKHRIPFVKSTQIGVGHAGPGRAAE